jgi:hypothetical protein
MRLGKFVQLKRDVLKSECQWLDRDFKLGEIMQLYEGHTFGVISEKGSAVMLRTGGVFFELPQNALKIFPPLD